MQSKVKSIWIAVFFIGASFIFAWLLLFLKPSFGDGKKAIRVRFTEIEKIGIGTRVTLAGKPIGEVKEIHSLLNARNQDPVNGHIYNYELILHIDSKARVFPEDIITSQTSGLLGERSIAIIPQYSNGSILSENSTESNVLYAQVSPSVEDAFEKFGQIAIKAEQAIDRLQKLVEKSSPNLQKASHELAQALSQLNTQLERANELKLVDQIAEMSQGIHVLSQHFFTISEDLFSEKQRDQIKQSLQHLNSLAKSLDKPERIESILNHVDQTMEKFNALETRFLENWPRFELGIDSFSQSAQQIGDLSAAGQRTFDRLDKLSAHIYSGKGSLGKFLVEDDLYLNMNETLSRVNILVSDINNYGLLFHNSRQWRNLRMDEAAKIKRLHNPKAFEKYYRDQIEEIYVAIGRIREMMEEAKNKKAMQRLGDNPHFDDSFSLLLRKLKTLSEQVTLLHGELKNTSKEEE